MQDSYKRVDECRVCGRNDWIDVIDFGPSPLAGNFLDQAPHYDEPRFPLEGGVCSGCWLMSLRHVVDPKALFGHYLHVSSDSELITRHMQYIAELCVQRFSLNAGEFVVELGSNIGTQLKFFQQAGLRVLGVDPAKNLAEIAVRDRVETITSFFTADLARRIAGYWGKARLVLARQCFAHIHDVHDVLDGATAILRPDGILAIEVPYLLDMLEQNQFDTIFHEHLSYFSVGTLSRLFAAHGLRIVDVERVAVRGGSIVVFASPSTTGREPSPAVADLLALEERNGLNTAQPYRRFAERAERVQTAVGDLVRGLAADGKRVAGYGAPAKGSMLLHACGLGPREVRFCSDTTSLKHDKVLPGSHIPVWSPERARRHAPDYYLLLAWNYTDEIIRKEQAYLEQGGRFIVPIPEPRIVAAESAKAA